jgi:hypothetical protein
MTTNTKVIYILGCQVFGGFAGRIWQDSSIIKLNPGRHNNGEDLYLKHHSVLHDISALGIIDTEGHTISSVKVIFTVYDKLLAMKVDEYTDMVRLSNVRTHWTSETINSYLAIDRMSYRKSLHYIGYHGKSVDIEMSFEDISFILGLNAQFPNRVYHFGDNLDISLVKMLDDQALKDNYQEVLRLVNRVLLP